MSAHMVITMTRSPDLGRVLGSHMISALNNTQNYFPQKVSTTDLGCDCDAVMYRYVSVWASRRSHRLTNGGRRTWTVCIWGLLHVRVASSICGYFSVIAYVNHVG